MANLNIKLALALGILRSPRLGSTVFSPGLTKVQWKYLPAVMFVRPATRILSRRPIYSMSLTMLLEMNSAQMLMASAAISGEESAANAGVKAEAI